MKSRTGEDNRYIRRMRRSVLLGGTPDGLRESAKIAERQALQREVRSPYAREITEFIGTFMLVFAGSGAAVANQLSDGAITHVGASFVSGAVLAAIIYAFGHLSGAHVNPAVTLAFWSSGFCSDRKVLPYLVAQVMGGVCASLVLLFAFGPVANLGATLPRDGNWLQAFILETLLTFIMMMVVLGAGLDRRAHIGFGGIAIGLTVALEVLIMGPITGGSMNPARSFAPALVAGVWQHQWLYWFGPILGGQIAVSVYRYISDDFSDFTKNDCLQAPGNDEWMTVFDASKASPTSAMTSSENALSKILAVGNTLSEVADDSTTVTRPNAQSVDEHNVPIVSLSELATVSEAVQYLDLW